MQNPRDEIFVVTSIVYRMEVTSVFITLLEPIYSSTLFLVYLFLFENLIELIPQGRVFSSFPFSKRVNHLTVI